VRFVEPNLIASVEYSDMTNDGTLRHPVYKGLRDDIAPEDVGPPDPG
jgi:bifunctional non-homologous end joining protein LigD